jgi:hypothetical protein
MLPLILIITAIVLFILAGLGVPASRFNLVAFGLACWALSTVIATHPL